MFLDLTINTKVFGTASILIGFYFLTTNYQQSKQTKNRLNWMVCSINGTCFIMLTLFLTILKNDFNLVDDLKFLALGIMVGQFFYFLVNKCTLRLFCVLLGNMVGFCFTNMLEACYFFTITDS